MKKYCRIVTTFLLICSVIFAFATANTLAYAYNNEKSGHLGNALNTEYYYNDDDIKVTVIAPPEANLPDGTRLLVQYVGKNTAEYKSVVQSAEKELGGKTSDANRVYEVYDIHFENANGMEIEPAAGYVSVYMKFNDPLFSEVASDVSETTLIHVADSGSAEEIPEALTSNKSNEVTAAQFRTAEFSYFAIVANAEDSDMENEDESDATPTASPTPTPVSEGNNTITVIKRIVGEEVTVTPTPTLTPTPTSTATEAGLTPTPTATPIPTTSTTEYTTTTGTFYVGLFTSLNYTTLLPEATSLYTKSGLTNPVAINYTSGGSISANIASFEKLPAGTYYLAETDQYGNPISGTVTVNGVEYTPDFINPLDKTTKLGNMYEVVFQDNAGSTSSVTLQNTYESVVTESTDETETAEGESESVSESSDDESSTSSTESTTSSSAKTGDYNPLALYTILCLAGLGTALAIIRKKIL